MPVKLCLLNRLSMELFSEHRDVDTSLHLLDALFGKDTHLNTGKRAVTINLHSSFEVIPPGGVLILDAS